MKTVVFIAVWTFCCFNAGKENGFSVGVGPREKEKKKKKKNRRSERLYEVNYNRSTSKIK